MSTKLLLNIVPQTSPQATASFIFLHGSGDSGNKFRNWVQHVLGYELTFPHIKITYPTAPEKPYTPNHGIISKVWFDRAEISIKAIEHQQTTDDSCELIKDLISQEVANGIPINRIMIGGFSMGGCLAMHVAFRFQLQLAGCISLSSFLNEESAVYRHLKSQKDKNLPPFLMCHGKRDPIVEYDWAKSSFNSLKDLGVDGKFHSYPNMLHEIKRGELEMVKEWIGKRIPEFQ